MKHKLNTPKLTPKKPNLSTTHNTAVTLDSNSKATKIAVDKWAKEHKHINYAYHATSRDRKNSVVAFYLAETIAQVKRIFPDPSPENIRITFKRSNGYHKVIELKNITYCGSSDAAIIKEFKNFARTMLRPGVVFTDYDATAEDTEKWNRWLKYGPDSVELVQARFVINLKWKKDKDLAKYEKDYILI